MEVERDGSGMRTFLSSTESPQSHLQKGEVSAFLCDILVSFLLYSINRPLRIHYHLYSWPIQGSCTLHGPQLSIEEEPQSMDSTPSPPAPQTWVPLYLQSLALSLQMISALYLRRMNG